MKIGIDARFFGIASKGLGRYTQKLIEGLEKEESEDTYEIFLTKEGFLEYTPTNPRFRKVLVNYPWYGFREQILYPWFLYRRKLDLIHFPHFNVPILYKKPFVVTIHDLILLHYPTPRASAQSTCWYKIKYFFYTKVIASAVKRAEKVLVVSEFTRMDVSAMYAQTSSKIIVTTEGVDQYCLWSTPKEVFSKLNNLWARAQRKEKEKPFALYVGNAYPHKNLEIFLFLAMTLPERDIVLVGKSDYFYQRLENLVREKHISNIYFVGGVTDSELALLYRHASLYIFPSFYEGFGLPPLEAMQYGLPVLAAHTGSLPEVLGQAALFADPHNSQDFSVQYQKLWADESLRQHLRQKGFTQASGLLWLPMAQKTHNTYRDILRGYRS